MIFLFLFLSLAQAEVNLCSGEVTYYNGTVEKSSFLLSVQDDNVYYLFFPNLFTLVMTDNKGMWSEEGERITHLTFQPLPNGAEILSRLRE